VSGRVGRVLPGVAGVLDGALFTSGAALCAADHVLQVDEQHRGGRRAHPPVPAPASEPGLAWRAQTFANVPSLSWQMAPSALAPSGLTPG